MRRITPVKSQEALKSDIFCLKRQLSQIADENQLLKVKIRRLENELRRKDKYIECYRNDPKKDRQVGRFLYDNGASMIYKLQTRNQQLEDTLLERDLQNEKLYNEMKTMCLYGHMDCKANRGGSGTNVARKNSGIGSIASCHSSLNRRSNAPKRFDPMKPGRLRSSSSLRSDNSEKNAKNRYCVSSTGDTTEFQRGESANSDTASVIKNLETERIVDKLAIRSQNAEIARLSAELREIKNLLRSKEDDKVSRSTSTTRLDDKQSAGKCASRDCPNFIAENKRNVARSRGNRIDRKSPRKTIQYPEIERRANCKTLPTVDEQNEEISLPDESCEEITNIINLENTEEASRPKTRIEYVFDSEVSSDGEEFCLPSTLRNFLQQAVNTVPNDSEDDVISE